MKTQIPAILSALLLLASVGVVRAQANGTIDTFGISGGAFELEGVGLPSTLYRLEATQDFVTWTEVDTFNSNVIGEFRLRDADVASFPHRFYRVVTP
jgi:hypothetical protein